MAEQRLCSVEACFKDIYAKGFCKHHYYVERKKLQNKVCSVADCVNPVKGRGLCSKHHSKLLKYGDPQAAFTRVVQTTCSMPGCEKPFVAKGFCRKHYARSYNNGSPYRGPTEKEKALKFIEEVALSYAGDACLSHPCKRAKLGYYVTTIDGVSTSLHRYVCARAHGPAPEPSMDAAHECGNGWCINPRHLSWKTRLENIHDKKRHGTWLTGERLAHAKLTEENVREIRELAKTVSQREIARRFGLGYKHVWHVIHDTWKHVK